MLFRWLLLGATALAWSCGATSALPASPTSPPSSPSPSSPLSASARASSPPAAESLQKSFTGQAQPSLVIKNAFPTSQHLFIDWVARDVLAPGASQTFALSPGTHTITSAESADPDDHSAAITESFQAGYAYRYEIMAR